MHLLDNYTIDARTRYENHTLIYTAADSDPIELRGILAAAILAALVAEAASQGISRATALRWNDEWQTVGLILKIKYGVYKKIA